jgi:hypothetical protein
MMKKVMFVLVSLLIVSTVCFALESGPSNKVGYVKITCTGGAGTTFTSMGLPFVFWTVPTGGIPTYGTESRKPSSILGTQPACSTATLADRVIRQDNAQFAYRTGSACSWTGSLETAGPANMEPGRFYYFRMVNRATRDLVLAGEADITANGIPGVVIVAPVPPQTVANIPYSWRDPRELPRDQLNLRQDGFRGGTATGSDRVLEPSTGKSFWFRTSDNTWQGTPPSALMTITPGRAYWIQNKHGSDPAWTYTYRANGQPITLPGGGETPELIKATLPDVKATKTHTATK